MRITFKTKELPNFPGGAILNILGVKQENNDLLIQNPDGKWTLVAKCLIDQSDYTPYWVVSDELPFYWKNDFKIQSCAFEIVIVENE